MENKSRFSPIIKAVANVLVLAITLETMGHAAPEIKPADLFTPKKLAHNIAFPASIARVESSHRGDSDELIYLIQDAHTNYSAQKNIAALIDHLAVRKDIRSVYVEAGFGDVSLRGFRETSSARRKDVGLRYLRKGELSGAELRDLVSDRDLALWGVEDPDLYW